MSLLGGLFNRHPSGDESRAIGMWDEPWGRSGATASGVLVDEYSALSQSAVWACQTLIADSVAMLPEHVYRKTTDGRVELDTPAVLTNPNTDTTKIEFDSQRILSLLGWGDCFLLLTRQNGDPFAPVVERWVLDPSRVSVQRAHYGSAGARYFVDGREIDPLFFQHIRGHALPGQLRGMSVVTAAMQSLGMSAAAEDFAARFFSNGAVMSGVLQVPAMPEQVSKDVTDRLRADFAARYAGSANAHKPAILTGGTTWHPMSVNPVDAALLETRKFQTAEIARWFRVPPHMIGDLEKTTSWGTGIEQQSIGFVTFTLMPWLARLEQADSQLLPRQQYARYETGGLMRGDLKSRFEAYAIARQWGWMSVNDIRELEDEEPVDNGDVYLEPLNMTEAGSQSDPAGDTTPDSLPATPPDTGSADNAT